MRTAPVVIEGLAGPLEIDRPPLFGRLKLLVDGQVVPPAGRGRYLLPGSSGIPIEATMTRVPYSPFPNLTIFGVIYPTGPLIPMWLRVLVALPIGLIIIGGLVGALLAAVAIAVNLIALQSARTTIRAATLVITTDVAALVVLLLAAAAVAAVFA